jgi:hypothetical protein
MAPPQDGGDVRHSHRHARMAAVGTLHGIDCQDAQGVDGELLVIHEQGG